MRYGYLSVVAAIIFNWNGSAAGQSPRVLYTFDGTGNTQEWMSDGSAQENETTLENTNPGQLTVTELGDPIFGEEGGTIVIREGHNRRMESSTATGGLDVTGLEFFEIDVSHNGTGNVDVQFYTQSTPSFTYLGAGTNGPTGVLGGADYSIGPGIHTLKFPITALTPMQNAYVRTVGLNIRNHFDQGNLTWNVYELRTVGTPLTVRNLATHDVGSSDNGLQGAFANFEIGAIIGNNGAQNQTGLVHNASGSGSLQWVDRGGAGTTEDPSGAAIGWGNGTAWNGNSFNERLTDVSNYTHVTYRISATDPLDGGGVLGFQAYYQTGNFDFQTAGNGAVPIDGTFYDVTLPLIGVTNRANVQFSGLNLFAHENDLTIDVDLIRYEMIEGLPGDYNENGILDAADYTVWRDKLGQMIALPNEAVSPNVVDAEDYDYWVQHFGEFLSGSSGGSASLASVPEPNVFLLGMLALVGALIAGNKIRW